MMVMQPPTAADLASTFPRILQHSPSSPPSQMPHSEPEALQPFPLLERGLSPINTHSLHPQLRVLDDSANATRTSCDYSPRSPHALSGSPGPDQLRTEDIEMGSIGGNGHRRRRSSLMNPPISVPYHYSSRHARGHSMSRTLDDAKISEETSTETAQGARAEDSMSDEDLHDDEEMGLTRKERRRKQKKRRRNAMLDQRIAKNRTAAADEQHEADQNVMRKLTINCVLIGLWYIFSLSISIYNKWMFDPTRLNFPFPLFTTSVHMVVQFSLAGLVLLFVPSLRPQNSVHLARTTRSDADAEKQPIMSKMFYLTRIGPCGAATGLDIGLGNTSLKFITLTFYTMCKSSSLAFVLMFAFLFRLESPTWRLVSIIGVMTLGVVMMVAGEVEFKLGGFMLVISAAFFSGFRWGLTQILLLRNPATSNPFSSIFFLAPVMFVTLMAIAIPAEGFGPLIEAVIKLSDEWGYWLTPLLILFPGTMAFLMTASEFALLQRTSVVTLSIAGIFKEAVTISAAALVFDDKLTPVNISGLFVTLGAIAGYNWIKITKMREDARQDVHREHMAGDLTDGTSPSSDTDSDHDEDDRSGEESGLLRQESLGKGENLVTTGGDIIPMPRPSPTLAEGTEQLQQQQQHQRLD